MNTKPIKAWAVVNKKTPVIDVSDIYGSKSDIDQVFLDDDEKFIRVEIKEVEK